MGSFNSSCAVTHTPLGPKDEVVLVYLANVDMVHHRKPDSTFRGMLHDGISHFDIVGYPMQAFYKDCGVFDVPKSTAADMSLSILKGAYTSTPSTMKGEHDYSDYYDVERDTLTHELIQEMILDGMMYLESDKTLTRRKFVQVLAIRKSAYDVLMQNTKVMTFTDGVRWESSTREQYYDTLVRKFENIENEYQILMNEQFNELSKDIGEVEIDVNGKSTVYTAEQAWLDAHGMAYIRSGRSSEDNVASSYLNYGSKKWMDGVYIGTYGTQTAPLYEILEIKSHLTALVGALNYNHIPLIPSHLASQDDDKIRVASTHISTQMSILSDEQKKHKASNYYLPFEIEKPTVVLKISDLQKYADEWWDERRAEELLAAVQDVREYFCDEVLLTPQLITKRGLGALYSVLGITDMNIKIIIDI